MSDEQPLDKTEELYHELPFMEDFPFDEYSIALEVEGTDFSEIGVSEILINTLGSFGTNEKLNFFYREGIFKLMVSFELDNICEISENSNKVVQLTPVKEYLDEALNSKDLNIKLEALKKSKRFIQKLESDDIYDPPFEAILYDMLLMNDVTLTTSQILGIIQLNYDNIVGLGLSDNQREAIYCFLNFRLHYARIILGIVIATKIH